MPSPDHRTFLMTSLAISALAGSSQGFGVLLGWLKGYRLGSTFLLAHGQLQVYGFLVLFTMGVAILILPRTLRVEPRPSAWNAICLAAMVGGIGFCIGGYSYPGLILQILSGLTFCHLLALTRASAPPAGRKRDPLTREHDWTLAFGNLWLLLAPALSLCHYQKSLDTVLWGFCGLYIVGVGHRSHPAMLAIKPRHSQGLGAVCVLWNLSLLSLWVGPTGAWSPLMGSAVGLYLLILGPFRTSTLPPAGPSWLRLYIRISYAWLFAAVVLCCLAESGMPWLGGAARHALGSGFVLTMVMGMGLRMIPAFETRRLIWSPGPWVLLGLIVAGTGLRVPAQALGHLPLMATGGTLQFLAILLFVGLLLGTILRGKRLNVERA